MISFSEPDPAGYKALLNGLNSVIDNTQFSQRLQDMVKEMLSEYNTTIERLSSIKKQLEEFVDASESGIFTKPPITI